MSQIAGEIQKEFAAEYLGEECGKRRRIVNDWMQKMNISRTSAFRILKAQGAFGKKKKRRDAGRRALGGEAIKKIASIKEASRRKTGTVTMPVEVAIEIAEMNEPSEKQVSAGYMRQLLRESGMDSRTLSKANPTGKVSSMPLDRRSGYPLECLICDVSVCLQYRFGKNGKGAFQFEPMTRYYGKDIKNYTNKRRILFRYAAVDHFTKNIFIHYYYSSGERADDWIDFLIRCFFKKPHSDQFPFMGVPQNIYSDKGSGLNNSQAKVFMNALGIDYSTHFPGNPRAKGAVEVGHRIWQNYFESRLSIQKAESLEDLNNRKDLMLAKFNFEKVHSGANKTRFEMWELGVPMIPAGKFRTLPENRLDAIRALAYRKPESRVVNGIGLISYDGTEYRVTESSLINEKVTVYPSPYHTEDVLIVLWKDQKYEAAKIERDEFGFASDAIPFGTWKRAKDAIADTNLKLISGIDLTGLKAFPDEIGATAGVSAISARIPKNEIEIPGEDIFIQKSAAKKYLHRELGPSKYRAFINEIDSALESNLKRSELEELKNSLLSREEKKHA